MTVARSVQIRRKAGRGALVILALLMAVSGALRLGDGIGIAMARTGSADVDGPRLAPLAAMDCPAPPIAVAEALSLREARLEAQEAALADRMAALALADQAIEIRLTTLSEAEAKLQETIARADGASEADLAQMTEMYQTMKPKDAAILFGTMDPEFATGFLARMRPEAAAAILSGMQPENAYAISVLLAGRNAKAPKN